MFFDKKKIVYKLINNLNLKEYIKRVQLQYKQQK